MWTLQWEPERWEEMDSLEELISKIAELHQDAMGRGQGIFVDVGSPCQEYTLLLGLGYPYVPLSFKDDKNKHSFSSIVDTPSGRVYTYSFFGYPTEIESRNCVEYAIAMEAVKQFFLELRPPSCVTWEQEY
jgi:hypothetical protein